MTIALLVALQAQPAIAGKRRLVEAPPIEDVAAELAGKAQTSARGWELLVELCDDIGHRLAGSEGLDKAIELTAQRMREGGLDVRTEPIEVPVWIRGTEELRLVAPYEKTLPILALGGSVSTPEEGLRAEVLVVRSFDELEERSDEAEGKIVLYDVPFTTYGETVRYRWAGAIEAAKLGAVASLVRSVTPVSLATPHTGTMGYEDGVEKIPSVAVTVEDAAMMGRMADRGQTLEVEMRVHTETRPDVMSANVIGEVLGREKPEEIVVVGCHLDSWDVGQGAQDDGVGCIMAMEAARLIGSLEVAPRRTVRAVLYTNEENGLRGGKGYAEAHADEPHVAAIEADIGGGPNAGFSMKIAGEGEEQAAEFQRVHDLLSPYLPLLQPFSGAGLREGGAGADISPLVDAGTVGFGLDLDRTGYWPVHHTRADTIEKIDPMVLRDNITTMALWAYVLAEVDGLNAP